MKQRDKDYEAKVHEAGDDLVQWFKDHNIDPLNALVIMGTLTCRMFVEQNGADRKAAIEGVESFARTLERNVKKRLDVN